MVSTCTLHKSMGLVADIFNEEALASLRGTLAIGHTRYSTTGDSALLNAQPIMVQSNKGAIALAHNGNLVNALSIRRKLESQGSIFQTNSDTEVIVHLIAHSREQTLPDAMCRLAAPSGRRFFAGDDLPGPHLCGPRPARLPPARDGAHPRHARRKARYQSSSLRKPAPSI